MCGGYDVVLAVEHLSMCVYVCVCVCVCFIVLLEIVTVWVGEIVFEIVCVG